jgi:hypothetical protein
LFSVADRRGCYLCTLLYAYVAAFFMDQIKNEIQHFSNILRRFGNAISLIKHFQRRLFRPIKLHLVAKDLERIHIVSLGVKTMSKFFPLILEVKLVNFPGMDISTHPSES